MPPSACNATARARSMRTIGIYAAAMIPYALVPGVPHPKGTFLALPLLAGANAGRLMVFAIAFAAVLFVVRGIIRRRPWAPAALASA